MNASFSAFLALIIGVGIGVYFGSRYKQFLTFLVYALRLVTDRPYTMQLYDTLCTPTFYSNNAHRYALLAADQHNSVLTISRPHVLNSLHEEYTAIGKELFYRFVRIIIAPLIIVGLMGQLGLCVYVCILSILLIVLHQTQFVLGRNYSYHARINILLRHAYSDAGYVYDVNNPLHARTKAKIQPQETNQPDVSYDNEDAILEQISQQPKNKLDSMHITWERVWWANDITLSVLLSVLYWFTNAQTIGDYLLGSFQLFVCLQIFFVGVWATIKIALRLLNKYS